MNYLWIKRDKPIVHLNEDYCCYELFSDDSISFITNFYSRDQSHLQVVTNIILHI